MQSDGRTNPRSQPMARVLPPSPSLPTGTSWEVFVRRAMPLPGEGSSSETNDSQILLIAPQDLPAPFSLPTRTARNTFSHFYLDDGGTRVRVPYSAIVRDHNSMPVASNPPVCHGCPSGGCSHGWEVPNPRDVVVLAVRDGDGDLHHGWYLRFRSAPKRLVRMPFTIVQKLWFYIRREPELRGSSLGKEFMDAYLTNPCINFDALALVRYQRLQEVIRRLDEKRGGKRTRNGSPVTVEAQRSAPATPLRVQAVVGQCSVCLEEDIELNPNRCCAADRTCVDCHTKLRHCCPICDRNKVNASYQCLTCNNVVSLRDYGLPCATCGKHALCGSCYGEHAECVTCDPLRDESCCDCCD